MLTENPLTQLLDSSKLITTGLEQLAQINSEPLNAEQLDTEPLDAEPLTEQLDAEPSSSYYIPKKSSEVNKNFTTAPTHQSRNTV